MDLRERERITEGLLLEGLPLPWTSAVVDFCSFGGFLDGALFLRPLPWILELRRCGFVVPLLLPGRVSGHRQRRDFVHRFLVSFWIVVLSALFVVVPFLREFHVVSFWSFLVDFFVAAECLSSRPLGAPGWLPVPLLLGPFWIVLTGK